MSMSENVFNDNMEALKNGQILTLRKPTVDDAERMVKYLNIVGGESDNLLFGAGEFRLTVDQERSFIENLNQDPNSFMVLGFALIYASLES